MKKLLCAGLELIIVAGIMYSAWLCGTTIGLEDSMMDHRIEQLQDTVDELKLDKAIRSL